MVLTGAGISAESGISMFRSNDGLWNNQRIEDVATPGAWQRNPEVVWRFYQQRRRQLLEVEPNPAHIALAKLEQVLCDPMSIQFVKAFNYQSDWESHWLLNSHQPLTLITQNVDDLHQRAGSGNVITMHGQLRYLRCLICQDSQSILRLHVVWFGETPFGLSVILNRQY